MTQLIIAGNYRQYQNYLRKTGKLPHEAIYIAGEKDLCGRTGEIVCTGEFWLNSAFKTEHLNLRGKRSNMNG